MQSHPQPPLCTRSTGPPALALPWCHDEGEVTEEPGFRDSDGSHKEGTLRGPNTFERHGRKWKGLGRPGRRGDYRPSTVEEVVNRPRHRWFRLREGHQGRE